MHFRLARSAFALIIALHVPAGLAVAADASGTPAPPAAPAVGDPAPDWTLPGSDGVDHSLSELRGQHVVIAFFPKAFTGG